MGARINQTPVTNVRTNTRVDAGRQAQNDSFGSRVKTGVSATAQAVATGAAVAAPVLPGGAIVTAAVNGLEGMAAASSSGQRTGGTRAMMSGAYGVGGAGGTAPSTSSGTASVAGSNNYEMGMQLLEAQASSNMQFLTLQNQMQQESQKFNTLSNVMKTRADAAKNTIQNIR